MARVTIEVVDRSDGKVAVIATPSFADLGAVIRRTGRLTPAETMAVGLLKRIYDEHMLMQKTEKKRKGSGLWLAGADGRPN